MSKARPLTTILSFLLLLSMLVGTGGCTKPKAAPTPTRTPYMAVAPTASITPLPPATATPTLPPSPMPAASPSPTQTSIAREPTPTIAANVDIFTGLAVPDPERLNRRPIAVKISNSSAARPQYGLNEADVVFEHLAEGGITRFTAIFYGHDASRIGPVRSARLIDLEIPVIMQAFFVYSGASPPVTRMIQKSDFADLTLSDWFGDPGFYRIPMPGKAYEHTLFTDTKILWSIAKRRGWNKRPVPRGWVFTDNPPAGGSPATDIFIPYSAAYSNVTYRYDLRKGAYLRWILSTPHTDALTGKQVSVDNVVILYVNHVKTPIVEDALGAHSIQIQIWGQGQMQLCRDGKMYAGKWVRSARHKPLLFLDANGNPLPLKPGNTWIQLVPLNMKVKVK